MFKIYSINFYLCVKYNCINFIYEVISMEFMTNIRKASSALHSDLNIQVYKRILDKKLLKKDMQNIYTI